MLNWSKLGMTTQMRVPLAGETGQVRKFLEHLP
jgi:hypothetical protein